MEFFSRAVAELFGDEERAPGQSRVNDSISRMVISDPKTRKMKRQFLVRFFAPVRESAKGKTCTRLSCSPRAALAPVSSRIAC